MFFTIPKYYDNMVLRVPVRTSSPQIIHIKVSHKSKPNTVYFHTYPVINGENCFIIKIPKFPDEGCVMELYNESNGHDERDKSFQFKKPQVRNLFIPLKSIDSKIARDFLSFCDDLSEDAGWLPAKNKMYLSLDGKFRVDYKDVIRDDDGTELTTPARVNAFTKVIEISKKYYQGFTVPGRKAILLHEFSHVYVNETPENEFEADYNAIKLYLLAGNPKIDALTVFLKTFQNTPSNLNTRRYNALKNYIDNFSN